MKNVNRILSVLLFLVLTVTVQAQNDQLQTNEEKTELSKEELKEAKSRFAALLDSLNYKKHSSMFETLAKNQSNCTLPDFNDEASFIPWMKENIHLSEFKSLEEAMAFRKEYTALGKKVNNQDLRLNQLLRRASREQGIEIIQPLLDETEKGIAEKQ